MAEPYLSEIKLMSFNYPPKGWALCNGQLLPINQNQALFALLGTTYGGNGQTNFALPNLQGRVPIHTGSGHTLGQSAGEAAHTLSLQETPTHVHVASASSQQGNQASLVTNSVPNILAAVQGSSQYGPASNLTPLIGDSVSSVGGSQAHNNMQPYLVLNFCIALQGIFPSQN